MLEVHATYDRRRLEKLARMFGTDPRQGNPAFYVREHFNRKRICESCGARTTKKDLAVASSIVEGPEWVLPISVSLGGQILIDLEESIPDQSNFLFEDVIDGLGALSIQYVAHGGMDYAIPVISDRETYLRTLPEGIVEHYARARNDLSCRIVTDASPDDVLKWDTEVGYDWENLLAERDGDRVCGYNVETQYFQWLAEHRQLVVTRISDRRDVTLAVGYSVPGDYDLTYVNAKCRTNAQYKKYALERSLVLATLDYGANSGAAQPLRLGSALAQMGLGSALQPGDDVIWHPIPVVRPRLEFANRLARQTFVDCFGTT